MAPPELERVSERKTQKRRRETKHKNTHNHTTENTHNSDLSEPIPNNQSDVSLSLAKHVISTYAKESNLVMSPLTIRVVLGMVAAGSNAPTRDQILGFLKSNSIKELNFLSSHLVTHVLANGKPLGGPHLFTANGVWVDQSLQFKPAFNEIIQNSYKAASDHVDFQTQAEAVRAEVNRWAVKETNGKINDFLPRGSVNHETRLIFANAVYFKGLWQVEFDASVTKDKTFFLLNGSSIEVPFMTNYKMQYVSEFDGFKVLRLPYKQGKDRERKFSMYFFLPDANDGLPALLERAGSESRFIESHIPEDKVQVGKFRIPKFIIEFEFQAPKVLKKLGVMLPFSMGGLTEMVDSAIDGVELYVSDIFQKAYIEVNEKGTKAVAVVAARKSTGGCAPRMFKYIDFVADHPFMFAIREDVSGEVLFIGQLVNPLDG